jgi:hypothetical protein
VIDDPDRLAARARVLTRSIIASHIGSVNAMAEVDVLHLIDEIYNDPALLYTVLRLLGLAGAGLAEVIARREGQGSARALAIVARFVEEIDLDISNENEGDEVDKGD